MERRDIRDNEEERPLAMEDLPTQVAVEQRLLRGERIDMERRVYSLVRGERDWETIEALLEWMGTRAGMLGAAAFC